MLDAALVLLADHELAASTVAARVAASVRADPYAVASAGLATVSGTLHGGASLGIEALLDEIDRPGQAATVVGARLRRGERLRGFGHRLYPDGDPRAGFLLTRLRATAAGSPRMEAVDALLETTTRRGLPEPNVDLALAALAHVTTMTRGSGEAIFAIARTAGWIAHALEEYDRDTPIRPRAVYTGPPPDPDPNTPSGSGPGEGRWRRPRSRSRRRRPGGWCRPPGSDRRGGAGSIPRSDAAFISGPIRWSTWPGWRVGALAANRRSTSSAGQRQNTSIRSASRARRRGPASGPRLASSTAAGSAPAMA